MRLRGKDKGLTLLELVIAVLILSISTIAALRAMDQSRVAIGGAQDRMLTALAATNRAEEIKLLGTSGSLPQVVELGGQEIRLSSSSAPTSGGLIRVDVTAKSPRGPQSQRVVFISAVNP
ncbi:MAG: prepilin-type N-terminal cleavage/methylation domain-containing protein [Pseudomonadota bacterium]